MYRRRKPNNMKTMSDAWVQGSTGKINWFSQRCDADNRRQLVGSASLRPLHPPGGKWRHSERAFLRAGDERKVEWG